MDLAIWKTYQATANTLKRQILEAVDDKHTKAMRHPMWGYNNSDAQGLFAHLETVYGGIIAQDFLNNWTKLNTPWAP